MRHAFNDLGVSGVDTGRFGCAAAAAAAERPPGLVPLHRVEDLRGSASNTPSIMSLEVLGVAALLTQEARLKEWAYVALPSKGGHISK